MRKAYNTFLDFLKQLAGQNIGAFASSMTFFFVLALVPVILLACGIMTHFPISEQMMFRFMDDYFPEFLDDAVSRLVIQMYYQYQHIFPFAIIVLIWSAGKAMWGLKMGLNAANGVKETKFFLLVRIKASIYSVIMILVVFISIAMIIITERIAIKLKAFFPNISDWIITIGGFRFVVIWGALIILMSLVYTFVPNKKLIIRYQLPGAVFTATVWSFFSWGFSSYIDYFHSYDIYGNLSTLVIILVWMYTCMFMMLIGANINRFFEADIIRIFDKSIFLLKRNKERKDG